MKMSIKTLAATALTLGLSTAVNANLMYLDLASFGGNNADSNRSIGSADSDTRTGAFSDFGFSRLRATSIYDYSDGTVLGNFYDTNIESDLINAGVPASGTALDGVSNVNIDLPKCSLGECDIDALSPLAPPLSTDNEGFLQTWDLQVKYHLNGTLTATDFKYTSGFMEVYFNDFDTSDGDDSGLAFSAILTSSQANIGNIDLYFDITYAKEQFLNIWNGSAWVDAADAIARGQRTSFAIDTNIEPPMPTADRLLMIDNNTVVRQTNLDGSIQASVPTPSSIALLGLGLLGFSSLKRRQTK